MGLNTLVIPRKSVAPPAGDGEPWVYLNCGHVQGRHQWGQEQGTDSRTCPMCLKVGPHRAGRTARLSGMARDSGVHHVTVIGLHLFDVSVECKLDQITGVCIALIFHYPAVLSYLHVCDAYSPLLAHSVMMKTLSSNGR